MHLMEILQYLEHLRKLRSDDEMKEFCFSSIDEILNDSFNQFHMIEIELILH